MPTESLAYALADHFIALMSSERVAQDTYEMPFTEFYDFLASQFARVLGNAQRRSAITDKAALQLLRHQPAARDHYLKLRSRGRTPKTALNAAVRQINKTARHD